LTAAHSALIALAFVAAIRLAFSKSPIHESDALALYVEAISRTFEAVHEVETFKFEAGATSPRYDAGYHDNNKFEAGATSPRYDAGYHDNNKLHVKNISNTRIYSLSEREHLLHNELCNPWYTSLQYWHCRIF